METIFIIMVGILILLAVSDLVVGVANDAVNFLNSAIGSKAAPLRIIMIIASLGIFIGATFSNGMMEVARKGIFVPELFSFNEVMIIFLAVMLTDIILLDVFNSLGMPTSTTVSLIFELLGAGVSMAVVLVLKNDESASEITKYINTGRALLIIAGILFSVIVAFSLGTIVQFFTRLIFTFKQTKGSQIIGLIWGGIAITAIVYFILIKGLQSSSFAGKGTPTHDYISKFQTQILFISFVVWTLIFAVIQLFAKFNYLKIIVLAGTFSLAMSFAGNDLVNFIGVPLAGIASYQDWIASGAQSPDTFLMGSLSAPVSTPILYLLLAGVIMTLTLWFSKKAKSVTETELSLSRQEEGFERFESSAISRSIVRATIKATDNLAKIFPKRFTNWINIRLEKEEISTKEKKENVFDLTRASVNLMVSAILIAIGTSYKLPLSTTYVTFMVAMGSSLSDGAWGRESAVYRVSGVLTVISGWFITALVAFTVSFIFALIINWGGIFAVGIILAIGVFSALKSKKFHKKRVAENIERTKINEIVTSEENIFERCSINVISILKSVNEIYAHTIEALGKQDRKKLKKLLKKNQDVNKKSKMLKDNIYQTVNKLMEDSIESAPYYVQVIDYLREMTHALEFIVLPSFTHVENNHKPLLDKQIIVLTLISETIDVMEKIIIETIEKEDFENKEENIRNLQIDLLGYINEARKVHLKRIKNNEVSTKNSMLYLNLLSETKNIALYMINAYKSHRDFVKDYNMSLKQ